ncbi:TEA/ATTS domain family-domain-containing protein [Mycena latifolia]|nr:TEA/ATTS domain family-domain-containing protein [Mycena latifolia]
MSFSEIEHEVGSHGPTTHDRVQSIFEMRRRWRRTSEGGEAVWSVNLEVALLEGLEQYTPTMCRDMVFLRRFPGRNQFISEYIWRKTGQRRTTKQIASRLQVLRESSKDHERTTGLENPIEASLIQFTVVHLLFPSPISTTTNVSSNHCGTPPLANGRLSSEMPHVLIYIDILPSGAVDQFHSVPSEPWAESQDIIHVSHHPRRLACIDPTVTFMSSSLILTESQFTVWTDQVVHTETAIPLTSVVDNRFPDATFLHRVPLIPGYWQMIVESPDPTRYTILHQVARVNNPAVIFSASYCFRYAPGFEGLESSAVENAFTEVHFDPSPCTWGG